MSGSSNETSRPMTRSAMLLIFARISEIDRSPACFLAFVFFVDDFPLFFRFTARSRNILGMVGKYSTNFLKSYGVATTLVMARCDMTRLKTCIPSCGVTIPKPMDSTLFSTLSFAMPSFDHAPHWIELIEYPCVRLEHAMESKHAFAAE